VLNEYEGKDRVWEIDIVKLWNSYDWEKYYSCNKCALACYLEPSLFTWKDLSIVKERIVEPMLSVLSSEIF